MQEYYKIHFYRFLLSFFSASCFADCALFFCFIVAVNAHSHGT